ncbi:thiamine phosphate synthase, partial [Staphylococcus pseudintermedius]
MTFNRKQLRVYFIAGTQDVKQGSLDGILKEA